MKSYQVLLSLLCINYIYSATLSCDDVEIPTKEACISAGLSGEDKERGYMYCCYIRYKKAGNKKERETCEKLNEYQYKNIDDYVKYNKLLETETDDFIVECSSIFLKFSFLSLILLLF